MARSITHSADRITSNLCNDFAGKNHGLPGRNSFRGLFVRRQKRLRRLKIFETQDSIKRRSWFVLGFDRLADTANIVLARDRHMSFLKKFLKTNYRDGEAPRGVSTFRDLSEQQLESHMSIARYGDFTLTDAVRPSYGLDIVPRTGYRNEWYVDQDSGARIPVLMTSVTRERLFDTFLSLLDPLGETVDVVLETSHDKSNGSHTDLYREQIDMPVLQSILYDFEDLLLDDGCCGIAILNPRRPMEVQLDEHKLMFVYGHDNAAYEAALRENQVTRIESLKFITEAEHVHSSSDEFQQRFEQLCYHLGMES